MPLIKSRAPKSAALAPRKVAHGVAIAIVNYNGGPRLRECLRAVCRQSVAPERILLYDNASQDDSCDGIRERFPSVEVRRFAQNRGFAAACNAALREADDCRWVAVLNSDALPGRHWLARMLSAAESLPDCAALSSQLISARDTGRLDGAGDVYHVCGAAWRAGHGQIAAEHSLGEARGPREVFSACAAAALYRRDAVLEAGGFDESFFCYFEDVDLSYRLRLGGHRIWHVPRAVARHVGGASSGPRSDFAIYHGHRNLVWTFFRNTPARLLWRHLPQHLAWNLATVLWFALRGRGRVILHSKRDALRGLPRILRERASLQRNAAVAVESLLKVMEHGWLKPYFRRRTTTQAAAQSDLAPDRASALRQP
ncbi:MAG: glycosyltransferase family 2 protein [Planctomycetia bacterium]|nr:glycosyltransferase family 2 protein [Planctomycetia bacterium]